MEIIDKMDKMVMISARIREVDKYFLKTNRIGITELINSAIFQRKNEIEGLAPNFEAERKRREAFQKKFSKSLQFMEKNGLIDKWISEENDG